MMSRTYRFRKSKKDLVHSSWVLTKWEDIRDAESRYRYCIKVSIDRKSVEGKKKLALFHSDKQKGFYNGRGPNWFFTEYCQKPYRANAREQLHKAMKDPEYEVMLLSKPKRIYWD